ncbi:MAG: threonine ammonia-lyase [Betaproteobacteria bacterium]|nr:threonine ammonia-lyase [Betaproteobacteria bacterium]
MGVTVDDIHVAAEALKGHVVNTPCLHSRTLSAITGAEVWLKFENHQYTASFKERGALNKLLSLTGNEKARGVIAASAGNHAQGVAHHATRLGIPAVIVMPVFTPHVKVDMTERHGAAVILHGETFDDAKAHALKLADERGLTFVHPYDDDKVIAGQGTIGLEMLDAQPDLDTLVIAIGGGGLIGGIAVAAHARNANIRVIGVQTTRFPSMRAALYDEAAEYGASTIAEGIAVKKAGERNRDIARLHVEDVLLVDEGDIEEAIVMLLEIEKTVVEGAGAASLAALLRNRERFAGAKVGLVLCGGNIDPLVLSGIIERGMVRAGRLARLQVRIRDVPGSLARIAALLAEANANIEEVRHQRAFTDLPVQDALLEVVVKARGPDHVASIVEQLNAAGFRTRV